MAMVSVPGGRLEYVDLPGDEESPPLLFLHEGLGSVGLWRGFPEEVARATGRRTVAFSRFGHGRSDPPPAPRTARFMHEEARAILPALRERLGLDDPILIGHSDGASIALIHAAEHPVRAVAVMAPHVFVEEVCVSSIREIRDTFGSGGLRERMARHHDDPDAAFSGWCDVWLSDEFASWNLEELLPAIDVPLLLVQGKDDEYGTLAQIDAIERGVSGPAQRLIVPGGHSPHLSARDRVRDAVVEFVRSS